jgi:hypothetical protein
MVLLCCLPSDTIYILQYDWIEGRNSKLYTSITNYGVERICIIGGSRVNGKRLDLNLNVYKMLKIIIYQL